jgi:hypothetical protein
VGYFDNEASDNHDANVAFVVRAVNCHDELVAALKESTDCIGCELTQEEYDECMGKVQLAIAKATAP